MADQWDVGADQAFLFETRISILDIMSQVHDCQSFFQVSYKQQALNNLSRARTHTYTHTCVYVWCVGCGGGGSACVWVDVGKNFFFGKTAKITSWMFQLQANKQI